MCTNGVNAGQLEQMIEQVDDHIRLERRWSHDLAHMAKDAGFEEVGERLRMAMAALDDVRQMLNEATETLTDKARQAHGATAQLV